MNNRKFLFDGQEVELIETLKTGYLVANIYTIEAEYEDEEFVDEHPYIVKQVFDTVPTLKHEQRVKELQAQVRELEAKKREMEREEANAKKAAEGRMKVLQSHNALKRLEDFINGNITHYVQTDSWEPKIMEFKDAKCHSDRHNLKLLTLYGTSKGNLEWKLNIYSDGSGSSSTVVPCTSLEEAKEVLQKAFNENKTIGEKSIELAKQYGLTIPPEKLTEYYQRQIGYKQKVVQDYEMNLAKAKQALSDLRTAIGIEASTTEGSTADSPAIAQT